MSGHTNTDAGNALRLVDAFGAQIRYVPERGDKGWLIWLNDGKRWEADTSGRLTELAKATASGIYHEAANEPDPERAKKLGQWAAMSQSRGRIEAMVVLAKSDPRIVVHEADLDADPWALNVQNGTLDLRTGELRPHDPSELHTRITTVAYNPAAEAPVWDRFLDWTTRDDEDLYLYLQKALGYSITGVASERVFHFIYGSGSNGKGKTVEAVRYVLGDYALHTQIDTWLEGRKRSAGGASPDLLSLKGARFVTTNESDDGAAFASGRIKEVVGGGDTITARGLYAKDYVEFVPVLKLWVTSNHKPEIKAADQAMWDRLRLVPYENRVSDDAKDRELDTKLQAEAEGILAWLVQGCLMWQRSGLKPTDSMTKATHEYHEEMDHIGQFVQDRCYVGVNGRGEPYEVTSAALFDAYATWCRENRYDALKQNDFSAELKRQSEGAQKGVIQYRRTNKARGWVGLALKEVAPTMNGSPI